MSWKKLRFSLDRKPDGSISGARLERTNLDTNSLDLKEIARESVSEGRSLANPS